MSKRIEQAGFPSMDVGYFMSLPSSRLAIKDLEAFTEETFAMQFQGSLG